MRRLRICLLFGGASAEHDVSLVSARNVLSALDPFKYEIVLIGIDRRGRWVLIDGDQIPPELPGYARDAMEVAFLPGGNGRLVATQLTSIPVIDVVFPVLHGTFGEDGTVQGILKAAGMPFVGSDVLGSAIAMDKDFTKRLLNGAGLPCARYITAIRGESITFERARDSLATTALFIKPARLGSSVGVRFVDSATAFNAAVKDAFRYDTKIMIEERIIGREIECGVLEDGDQLLASAPAEIIPASKHGFYSYDAKYMDERGADLRVPADLPSDVTQRVQLASLATHRTLCCEGMSRVDFFLRSNGDLLVNEVNTIPGFTAISMYPRMWAATGISCTVLMDKLIEHAIGRFRKEVNTLALLEGRNVT